MLGLTNGELRYAFINFNEHGVEFCNGENVTTDASALIRVEFKTTLVNRNRSTINGGCLDPNRLLKDREI